MPIQEQIETLHRFEPVYLDTVEEAQALWDALDKDVLSGFVTTEWIGDRYRMSVRRNKYQAADYRGIKTFDVALPQAWVDRMWRECGVDVVPHFVCSYDGPNIFGEPAPVTPEGDRILERIRG